MCRTDIGDELDDAELIQREAVDQAGDFGRPGALDGLGPACPPGKPKPCKAGPKPGLAGQAGPCPPLVQWLASVLVGGKRP